MISRFYIAAWAVDWPNSESDSMHTAFPRGGKLFRVALKYDGLMNKGTIIQTKYIQW